MTEAFRFFRSFLKQPAAVGSLVPSSQSLAKAMLDRADLHHARTVVELGPGTGAITGPLLKRIASKTLFLALELNREHVRELKKRFPRLRVFQDSAEHIGRYLARYRVPRADTIVSALPWTNMSPALQKNILTSVLDSITPNGTFVTFVYAPARWLPGAQRFHKLLRQHFSEIETSPIVWRNFPPAVVYRCRRPWRA